jgi:hypothetical protein
MWRVWEVWEKTGQTEKGSIQMYALRKMRNLHSKKAQNSFDGVHMARYVWWHGLRKGQSTFLQIVTCLLLMRMRTQFCIGFQEMEKKSKKRSEAPPQ